MAFAKALRRADRKYSRPPDAAEKVEDMDVPTFRLHSLVGDLKGFWSVVVRANWRIIFRFELATFLI
jgi:plasmid maintenance system killer protein